MGSNPIDGTEGIMSTKYPKWFRPNYPPYRPHKPPKTKTEYETIAELNLSTYEYLKTDFPKADHIYIKEILVDEYDVHRTPTGVIIVFCNKKEIPNPDYESCYKYYRQGLAQYNATYKEYKHYQAIWEKEQEELKLKQKKQMYEELKKEFEPS